MNTLLILIGLLGFIGGAVIGWSLASRTGDTRQDTAERIDAERRFTEMRMDLAQHLATERMRQTRRDYLATKNRGGN